MGFAGDRTRRSESVGVGRSEWFTDYRVDGTHVGIITNTSPGALEVTMDYFPLHNMKRYYICSFQDPLTLDLFVPETTNVDDQCLRAEYCTARLAQM